MQEIKQTVGVLIGIETRYNTDYIVVRVYRREEGASHPLGVSYGTFNEFGEFADLVLDGFVSESKDFIGPQIDYQDVHTVDLSRAKAMVKVLRKMRDRLSKDNANDPGDVFMTFCKVVGAQWVAHQKDDRRGGGLADHDWRWMSLTEGREYFRHLIRVQERR
jgi:hypothetical protein